MRPVRLAIVPSRWRRARALGAIHGRPLPARLRQRSLFPGHPLDRDPVYRDLIQPRIEFLRAVPSLSGVLAHQFRTEPRLLVRVLDDPNRSERDDAAIAHGRVALEPAVGEDLTGLVDLEAHPRLVIDVRPQMASR